MRSTNSSPRRRALHERTPSQTNEYSPPSSVRAVSNKYPEQEERHVYTATPYPTKPEQILPPRPGIGHEFVPDSRFHVDEGPSTSGTYSTETSHLADSSFMDQSITDPWDLSSTFDTANSPPQLWEDDPDSSKSSFPESNLLGHERPGAPTKELYSDEESTLPLQTAPTIKTVPPDSVSRHPSGSDNAPSNNSSPNFVPIGPPSSPNYEALDTSSLNFVRIGASSNQDSASRSNSVSSMNSLGTVIRYANATPWAHGSSSELGASRSHSFRSTPPYQGPASRSNSTRPSVRSHSRSANSSSGSAPRSDIQAAVVDSGVFIQYPTIRAPSSSGARVQNGSPSEGSSEDNAPEPTGDYSSDRFKSHLSTVTSRWSAEVDSSFPSPTGTGNVSRTLSQELSPPPAAMTRQRLTSSSVWLVNESEDDEFLDSVGSLPPRPTNPGVPMSNSSSSRSSSTRSNNRPGTSSSFVGNFLPTWARMYYTADDQPTSSALSLVEGNHPEPARPEPARPATSNSSVMQRFTSVVSRARASTNETQISVEQQPVADTRDPRNHWVKPPQPSVTRSGSSLHRLRHSWSPHLFPDRRVVAPKTSAWRAPSLDSRTEPLLGRRNIQVWSFCLGFLCPLSEHPSFNQFYTLSYIVFTLAWLIASFLPLPRKPELMMEENRGPELEVTLKARLFDLERRRYLNARWWRNLNRWMTPLGLVIFTIIITMAVVGTTVGF